MVGIQDHSEWMLLRVLFSTIETSMVEIKFIKLFSKHKNKRSKKINSFPNGFPQPMVLKRNNFSVEDSQFTKYSGSIWS